MRRQRVRGTRPRGACARSPTRADRRCSTSTPTPTITASVFTLAGPGARRRDRRDAVARRPRSRAQCSIVGSRRRAPAPRRARRRAVRRARRHRRPNGRSAVRGRARVRRVVGGDARRAGVPVRRRRPVGHATCPRTRREAFATRRPDFGPDAPAPARSARPRSARGRPLVAINCVLASRDVALARRIAGDVRERDGGLPGVRALGFCRSRRADRCRCR